VPESSPILEAPYERNGGLAPAGPIAPPFFAMSCLPFDKPPCGVPSKDWRRDSLHNGEIRKQLRSSRPFSTKWLPAERFVRLHSEMSIDPVITFLKSESAGSGARG
jgi:hypothetical protein